MRLTVPAFDFPNLVHSHDWVFLAPFERPHDPSHLSRPLRLPSGESIPVRITARRRDHQSLITLTPARKLDRAAASHLRPQLRRMLALDWDLSEFHALCANDPLLAFVAQTAGGRMLRSPTLFEDIIKTVCTTNCDWRHTQRMCAALCRLGGGNFPDPAHLLKPRAARLAALVPLGYRLRTVREVADLAHRQKLPLDDLAAAGQFDQAAALLKDIWGIGPYARSHILMLLGDFSTIPVDCEVLKYLRNTHFAGRPVTARQAVTPYESFGRYRYLAFKFGRMARKQDYARAAAAQAPQAARVARKT